MQEAQKHIYHCNHCGQLFESYMRSQQDVCNLCGQDPLSPPFTSTASLPRAEQKRKNDNHGIAGKDEADFFSMKKQKNKKKWKIFFALWLIGLASLAYFASNYNKLSEAQNQITEQNQEANKQILIKKREAVKSVYSTFVRFGAAETTQSKSSFVLNGSDIVLEMNKYRLEKFSVRDIYRSKFASFDLIETGEHTKVITTMRYTPVSNNTIKIEEVTDLKEVTEISADTDLKEITESLSENKDTPTNTTAQKDQTVENKVIEEESTKQKSTIKKEDNSFDFEVVFWNVDDTWKIDWQHYVRLNDTDWLDFNNNKLPGSPKRFRIYAREPTTESTSFDGYAEYKFSEALNNNKAPSQFPKSVYIKKGGLEHNQIIEQLNTLANSKLGRNNKTTPILTSFDPPNSIRIDVTLDHETIDDEVIPVVKKIHNFDWLTPPTKN